MADQQENLDQISDAKLFEEASADTVPEPPKEATQEAEKPETRARDEHGRFLPKTDEKPAEEGDLRAPEKPTLSLKAPPEEIETDKPESHRVPLTELLNERERRQNEQRQREQLQQQLWQLQQKLQEKEKPQQEPVDMFADPQAWEQAQMQKQEQWRRSVIGEQSLRNARLACMVQGRTEDFDNAYQAMQKKFMEGDEALRQQFLASPDPGEMMVNWYRRERTIETVGQDPEAFLAKALDAALENPEFLAKAVEKAKGVASTQPSQTKIPPSLSKATATSPSGQTSSDSSDAAIWNELWR